MKKVLASSEKGSTFAPAFGTEEGMKRGDDGSEKFFESLRPAQDRRRVSAVREKEPLQRNSKDSIKAEPEIQNRNLSTTIIQRRV